MSPNNFPHLLSQGRIGKLNLKNRIVVTAMGVSLAEEDGMVGERLIAYHEEQAKGGAGLIIMGVTGVAWPVASVCWRQPAISDDRFLPGLSALCNRVHSAGGKIAAQLHHGGPVATFASISWGHPLWVPSIPLKTERDISEYFLPEERTVAGHALPPEFKVLEQADIDLVVEQFRSAAIRAITAGFDGIEIHGGHGYLLSAFISPNSNFRTDIYGGPLENRMRLAIEVLTAVREAVGPDFPLWVKLDSREVGIDGGITIDDATVSATMFESAGADAITVTAYHDPSDGKLHSASHTPHAEAGNLPFASRIRAALSIPVIASGRIEPAVGDKAIGRGQVDFIAMGRKLLADPHLPNKLSSGKQVRPCIYCYTCISAIYLGQHVRCAVNPELGREYEQTAELAAPKHVAVIGGGPGGMESARRLREAGYQVTLIEKAERLGGTLRFASLAYEPNERLLNWLSSELADKAVDIRLNTEATSELLKPLGVDAVIVATGAVRDMPDIPGNHLDHVFSGDDIRNMMFGQASDALRRKTSLFTRLATKVGAATGATARLELVRKATHAWMPIGHRVVIVGGELVGLELAEFLQERGRKVAVIEEAPRLGKGLMLVRRMRIVRELTDLGVVLHAAAAGISIKAEAVTFRDKDGISRAIPADTVIVAKGAAGDRSLSQKLEREGFHVLTIGDADGVGYIEGAMRDASDAVSALTAV